MTQSKSSERKNVRQRKAEPVSTFEPTKLRQLQRAANDLEGRPAGPKRDKQLRKAERKVDAYARTAVDAAQKHGAALPNETQITKRGWRVEVVDTPEGSIAKPAYVVRFDANAPINRLSRVTKPGSVPSLERHHVLAAEQVCALYFASMKGAKLVGSYEGVVVQGGGGAAHMIDVACDAWSKLDGAMKSLLPVERSVVMEVAVYETPIETLARRSDLMHFTDLARAKGAVVQTLRCGLERLAAAWSIDLGLPQNANT